MFAYNALKTLKNYRSDLNSTSITTLVVLFYLNQSGIILSAICHISKNFYFIFNILSTNKYSAMIISSDYFNI